MVCVCVCVCCAGEVRVGRPSYESQDTEEEFYDAAANWIAPPLESMGSGALHSMDSLAPQVGDSHVPAQSGATDQCPHFERALLGAAYSLGLKHGHGALPGPD